MNGVYSYLRFDKQRNVPLRLRLENQKILRNLDHGAFFIELCNMLCMAGIAVTDANYFVHC